MFDSVPETPGAFKLEVCASLSGDAETEEAKVELTLQGTSVRGKVVVKAAGKGRPEPY